MNDPTIDAEWFAETYAKQFGLRLDFSIDSLRTEIDCILEYAESVRVRGQLPSSENEHMEAALGAYIGETLRRIYGGVWKGQYYADGNAINFYTSYVALPEYEYWPSRFISYRINNGPVEGSFGEHLGQVQKDLAKESGW